MNKEVLYTIWRDKYCFPDEGVAITPSGISCNYKFSCLNDTMTCFVESKTYSQKVDTSISFEYGRAVAKVNLIREAMLSY